MKLVIDLSSRQAITDFSNSTPAQTYVIKSQDTAVLNVYFVSSGIVQDLGSATTLKFGLVQSGQATLLVLDTAFSRLTDASGNVYYQGFPVFNTNALLTALGSSVSISCTGEVRYQQPDGEITHCLDIPFTVFRTILAEATSTATTANFTQPNVGSTVAISVVTTSFLSAEDTVSIGTNNDTYLITAVTDGTHFTAENLGTGATSPGSVINSGATVTLASPNVLSTYPDVSTLELITHKNQPGGYAGLSSVGSGYINNVHVLVDEVTVTNTDPAGLATATKLTVLAASFTQPAANSTVAATVASSSNLVANQAVFILGGGYYIVTAISGTSVTLKNNGDAYNVSSGTTVPSGAALLPAQAVSGGGGGGSPGQNAYTSTSANFTVPNVSSSVSITVGSTSWMGGNGQVLFIQGAGYYSISSITSSTQVTVVNLGTSANTVSGTTIFSPATVTPGGTTGATGSATAIAAYDTTTASFTMPAANATVSVSQSNTAWLGVGQVIYIASAGYFSVNSITNATTWIATNLNYQGNASASTVIASGSKVSPGGLVGATGSGGAGKNAFTTLTSNFTQPAVSSSVAIVVAQTSFMAVGEVLYVQGGGYYTVSTVVDLTDVTIVNLGSSGNASVGATVTGSGTQIVTPGGVSGVNAFTTTSANFTMPTNGSTVTVTVGSTAWMAQGQNLYIPTAGYFSISTITDGTHVVLTNLGSSGNATSGTTISSGVAVVCSGPAGSGGSGSGGSVNLTDAETTTGVSAIANSGGILKRFTSVNSTVTLTDNGTSIDLATGAQGTTFDPANGYYVYEDFDSPLTMGSAANQMSAHHYGFTAGGTQNLAFSTYGQDATRKCLGCVEFTTGTGSNASGAIGNTLYSFNAKGNSNNIGIIPGLGPLTFKTRISINQGFTSGQLLVLRMGLANMPGTPFNNFLQSYGVVFEFNPDTFASYWRCATNTNSTTPVYINTTTAPAIDSPFWLQLSLNSSWSTCTWYINGTQVAQNTSLNLSGGIMSPFVNFYSNRSSTGSAYLIELDTWYINYNFAR